MGRPGAGRFPEPGARPVRAPGAGGGRHLPAGTGDRRHQPADPASGRDRRCHRLRPRRVGGPGRPRDRARRLVVGLPRPGPGVAIGVRAISGAAAGLPARTSRWRSMWRGTGPGWRGRCRHWSWRGLRRRAGSSWIAAAYQGAGGRGCYRAAGYRYRSTARGADHVRGRVLARAGGVGHRRGPGGIRWDNQAWGSGRMYRWSCTKTAHAPGN